MTKEDSCEDKNDESNKRSAKALAKDEILMRQYEQLRLEVRKFNELLQKQVIRIISILGLILAYVGISSQSAAKTIILVVPFAIIVLTLMFVTVVYWIANLTEHIVTIQEEISVEHFSFEKKYGVGSKMGRTERAIIYSMIAIVTTIYIISIIFSWSIIDPPIKLYGKRIGESAVFIIYASLTAIFGITIGTFLLEKKPLKQSLFSNSISARTHSSTPIL